MPEFQPTYLLILGTDRGLGYVMREGKMAFPPTRQIRLDVGDRLLMYVGRGAFHQPGKDRGRVVGIAEVTSPITPLDKTRHLAGRSYTSACDIKITGLAAVGEGVILADLVDELKVFQPNTRAWSARIRRSILPLPTQDAELILRHLHPELRNPDETINGYLERIDARYRKE